MLLRSNPPSLAPPKTRLHSAANSVENDTQWIIGYDNPNEKVVVTDARTINKDIILVNHGQLEVRGTTFTLSGNIYLLQDSALTFTSATLQIRQDYAYQYGMQVYNAAKIEWRDVAFNSEGSWGLGLSNTASARFDKVNVVTGFITWMPTNDTKVEFARCKTIGEFVPMDRSTLSFSDSNFVLLWIHMPPASTMDTSLPLGASVTSWDLGTTSAFATGIPYNVAIRNCTDVNWAIMAESGSTTTLRNSTIRAVGSLFTTSETLTVSGVANESHMLEQKYKWGDIAYHFYDTAVQTWNFYPYGGTYLTLSRCVFGEVMSAGKGRVDVIASVCDGSGGYVSSNDQSAVFFLYSTNLSQTTSKGKSLLFCADSLLKSPAIDAVDDSFMLLANTDYSGEPAAHANATIMDIDIDSLEAKANQHIPIHGTARYVTGPGSQVRFGDYEVFYAPGAAPAQWLPTDGKHTTMVRDAALADWNTSSLAPGPYALKVKVQSNFGDPIEITATAKLLEGAIDGRACAKMEWLGYQ